MDTLSAAARTRNDEVAGLIEAYRSTGDRQAIERILALHGKILNHLVRRHARSSDDSYEDLLQVGYVGLIKAVNGYNAGSGAKFSSYAHAMIDRINETRSEHIMSVEDPIEFLHRHT